MIFLDGVGIGEKDSKKNPFFKFGFETFENIFGEIPSLEKPELKSKNIFLKGIDATLGVEGLPQSGTGQTSIFAGVNAQKLIGKHFGPFPYSTLIPILKEKSIVSDFRRLGYSVEFANAYPEIFFKYLRSGKRRLGAIARMMRENEIEIKDVSFLENGKALSAEIDNFLWAEKLKYDLPIIKPETAAERLLEISSRNQLTIFEHFHTDHLGHGRIKDKFNRLFSTLDKFLLSVLRNYNESKQTIVICSDHGNIEDLSTKRHTTNPALFIAAGKNAEEIFYGVNGIDEIKKALLKTYQ
ncbi:MAG: metalloenzyme [Chlorobi bacterium]|nr:metalloenzyme [Chlorobiota bacterium]